MSPGTAAWAASWRLPPPLPPSSISSIWRRSSPGAASITAMSGFPATSSNPAPNSPPDWGSGLDDEVCRVVGRHFADGEIVELEERWINLTAVPEAATLPFDDISPNHWLVSHVPWTEAEHTIRRSTPTPVWRRRWVPGGHRLPAAGAADVPGRSGGDIRPPDPSGLPPPADRALQARFRPLKSVTSPVITGAFTIVFRSDTASTASATSSGTA